MAGQGFKIADGYVEIHTKFDGKQVSEAIGKELGNNEKDIERNVDRHVSETIVRSSEEGVRRRRGRFSKIGSAIVDGIFSKGFPNIFIRGLLEGMTLGLANAQGFGTLATNPYLAAIGLTVGAAILSSVASGLAAGLLGVLAGGFSVALGGLAAFILKDNPKIQNAFAVMMTDLVQQVAKGAEQLVIPIVNALSILHAGLMLNGGMWHELFEPLVPVFPALAQAMVDFVNALTPGLTALSSIGAQILLDLAHALPGMGKAMSDFFLKMKENWPDIKEDFDQFFKDVGMVIGVLATVILWLAAHYKEIRAFTKFLLVTINPIAWAIAVQTALNKVAARFGAWLADQRAKWGSWKNALKAAVFEASTWIIAKIIGMVLTVAGWFARLWSLGSSRMAALKNAVVGYVAGMAVSVVARAQSIYSGVVAWFNRLPAAVRNALITAKNFAVSAMANSGTLLFGAGARIISGLISGIRSKIGELRGLLNSVTGWIPDWKGPEDRDKKLLEPAGRNIMGGLMRGIGSQLPTLQFQLAGVTGAIPAAMPRNQAPAGAVGSIPAQRSGWTLNLTVNAGLGADGRRIGRETARQVRLALDDYDRSVKR